MSATALPLAPRPPGGRPQRTNARSLAVMDVLFRGVCQFAAILILVVAFLLLLLLLENAWQAIRTFGFSFLFTKDWNPVQNEEAGVKPHFGSLAFIWGTVSTSILAMLIAMPLGVGTAACLSEIAGPQIRKVASFFVEMLAAIPSVVYGFWGVLVLAPLVQIVFNQLGGPNTGGKGLVTAGIILAIMIVPYITAITYDVCQAVPRSQREGSYALGATRWQTISRVVLPYAQPGIVAGAFLALGRALGETMAVTMLIGNSPEINYSIFAMGDSIASVLANQYTGADYDLYRSVLVELALVLLLVSVGMNALARLLLWRVGSNIPLFSWRKTQPALASPVNQGKPGLPEPTPNGDAEGNASPHGPPLGRRKPLVSAEIINLIMTGVLWLCLVFTMSLLVIIMTYLLLKGAGSLNWEFFTELPVSSYQASGGGLRNAIIGSLVVVGTASLMAVPIGILAAIYLAEYRSGPLAIAVRFVSELLGGVPSIVVGIFSAGLFFLVSDTIHRMTGQRIRFYGWSGAFALAVMMVPIVVRASEEALKLVPQSMREASYALGSSQALTVLRVTVPAALPAIVTAIFLSIARIAGETAPLLLTAGFSSFDFINLNGPTPTLPPYIFKYATSAGDNWRQQGWAAAFMLMVAVLVLNFGIRFAAGKRVVQASQAS